MSERAIVRRRFRPPDSGSTLVPGPVRELDEIEQRVGPLPDDPARQAEVPSVDEQVLPDGQLDVEGVLLGDHAEPGPDRGPVADRVAAEDGQLPAGRRRDAADHPHRRGLSRPVRPEEAERLAAVQVEIDPVHRREIPEPLGQAARADEHFTVRHPIHATWRV
jgi:hypothetical protein